MGFTGARDDGGVYVIQVEGQLIVGNRQELKELVREALDAGEPDFGPLTATVIGTGEGALFGIGLSLGLTRRGRTARNSSN